MLKTGIPVKTKRSNLLGHKTNIQVISGEITRFKHAYKIISLLIFISSLASSYK